MALSDIARIRLNTSDKSVITREVAKSDGVAKHFRLKNAPILTLPVVEVRKNNSLMVEGVDYTVNYDQGIISLTNVPVVNDELEFIYYWSVFSDVEVQDFLDQAGGNVTVASAKMLLAWAADAAKIAKRETLSGGGGLGQVVRDTSVAAKELRATAQALIDQDITMADVTPADGLTEIPWTENVYYRQRDQHIIRES